MSNHLRKAKRILSKVITNIRTEHKPCKYPGCPWTSMHEEDQHELASALVAAGYAIVPTDQAIALSSLAADTELWSSQQVAAYRGIDPGSVRKAMSRLGIRERRGYPARDVLAAWPHTEQEVPA